MIKSMTGFASVGVDLESTSIGATVRTVNHRYLDVQLRVPSSLAPEEARLRALVQRHASRGRVEVSVTTQRRRPAPVDVTLNEGLVEAVARAMDGARASGLVEGSLAPGDVLRLPHALTVAEAPADADEHAAFVSAVDDVVEQALIAVDAMRGTEGDHLRADLEERLANLAAQVGQIERAAAEGAAALRQRLAERVAELTVDVTTDETAVAQEVVRIVARSDVHEEIVRLRGHLAHWKTLADAPEPCGRKLDFLLQEMNREVNTLGAKAEGTEVSELVVGAKAELEKLREQVQNVE